MRFDERPLRAFPEWLCTDRKQGGIDGFTEAAEACQARTQRLQSMEDTLPYSLALH